MRRRHVLAIGAAGALLLAYALLLKFFNFSTSESPFEITSRPLEAAPICPWREPAEDLKRFFPGEPRYETETRILSGLRLELTKRLGRSPGPEEISLQLHRVGEMKHPLGSILTRRVKGEHGAIEVVVAVGEDGRVRGVRLQRQREPTPIAEALERKDWLTSFSGKSADSAWQLGRDIPAVPAEARVSAEAIVDGVRSLLILLDTASAPNSILRKEHH